MMLRLDVQRLMMNLSVVHRSRKGVRCRPLRAKFVVSEDKRNLEECFCELFIQPGRWQGRQQCGT